MRAPALGPLWIALLGATLAGVLGWSLLHRSQCEALPYHDAFALGRAREWTPIGGFWRVQDGAVINGSDAAGSKLLMGSPKWTDYQITTTLRLLAHGGDVGVVVRVSEAEIGVNAYRGYYVGLRSNDAALVLGRANYSWLEARPVPMGEPVLTGHWFRLHVVAVGCTVAAEAEDLETGVHRYAVMQDEPRWCITRGKAGLRSTDTASAWKDVSVAPATRGDLRPILAKASVPSSPRFPITEHDLYRLRTDISPGSYPFGLDGVLGTSDTSHDRQVQSSPVLNTADLRTLPRSEGVLHLRGVISSIKPMYLQDGTGGVRLLAPDPGALCIGDEVDAVGSLVQEQGLPMLMAKKVVQRRDRAAVNVSFISPVQAASGMFEGSRVELTGKLMSHRTGPDGSLVLNMQADGQEFEALEQNDPFSTQKRRIENGSRLRVRGIATISSSERMGNSFSILVQSGTDLEVLAGPSWLEGWRLVLLVVSVLATSCLGVYLVMQASRARMAAVVAERERLSHEVHDTLAQSFAGISYRLQGLRKQARTASLSQERLVEELDEVYEVVAGTHREASAIIAALRPATHEGEDLLTLIERASEQLFVKHGPMIQTQRCGPRCTLEPALSDALFRVALEGIANVLRHSQASLVKLRLDCTGAGMVKLLIEDDGVGFLPDAGQVHYGLQTMHKRCADVGAQLEISSAPGSGTRLSITAPRRKRSYAFPGLHPVDVEGR